MVEGADDLLAVTLTRAEWGRVLQSVRTHRRSVERKNARPGFDPELGRGQVFALEQLREILPKIRSQVE